MPALVSIDDIVERAFEAAEMDTGGPVTSAEMTRYANAELSALYDQIIDAYDGNYGVVRTSLTTNATGFIDAPADFYKLWAIYMTVSSGQVVKLRPFQKEQRPILKTSSTVGGGVFPLRYMLYGGQAGKQQIEVLPVTSTTYNLDLWYIPVFTPLQIGQAPAETFDAVQSGWEEVAVLGAAIRALRKERRDVSVLMEQRREAQGRIRHMATPRDAAEPMYVAQIEDYDERDSALYRGRPDRIW